MTKWKWYKNADLAAKFSLKENNLNDAIHNSVKAGKESHKKCLNEISPLNCWPMRWLPAKGGSKGHTPYIVAYLARKQTITNMTFLYKPPPTRSTNRPNTVQRLPATSLLLTALILMTQTPHVAGITVATQTADAASNYENNYEAAAAATDAAAAQLTSDTEYLQNYYNTRAINTAAATSPTYVNYGDNTQNRPGMAALTGEEAEQLRLRQESALLRTASAGFVPTTLTAAGQHYIATAAAAGQVDPTAATAENHGGMAAYATLAGDIDYQVNAAGYANEADSEGGGGTYTALSDLTAMQRRLMAESGAGDAGVDTNFAGRLHYFTPATYQQPYLRNYEFEQIANYQQQHKQQPQAVYEPNRDLQQHQQQLQQRRNLANYANDKQFMRQVQQKPQQRPRQIYRQTPRATNYEPQTAESSQQQLQIADGEALGLQISADDFNAHVHAESGINEVSADHTSDPTQSQQLDYYYYQTPGNHIENAHSETSSTLQQMQQQLEQQQHQLLQLQRQQQQLAHHSLPPGHIHHTPSSAAAIAGIPLGKHVQVTKHVPTVHSYQQQYLPFNQTVSIEVPQTVVSAVPRPLPIKVPVTKTVAVSKLQELKVPIEKVKPVPVERPIPYIVERRVPYQVEKQVATPYYYPYPIRVPIVHTVLHKLHTPRHHHYQQQQQHYHNPYRSALPLRHQVTVARYHQGSSNLLG